ncbi:MAG: hypothetical protein NTW21_31700 [Verrucomicrobia bacterium]|nr:hypothetical protein [Verrucomicrobiota bacterium]
MTGGPRLVIETAGGLRLLLADRAALAMLADLFERIPALWKGDRP